MFPLLPPVSKREAECSGSDAVGAMEDCTVDEEVVGFRRRRLTLRLKLARRPM